MAVNRTGPLTGVSVKRETKGIADEIIEEMMILTNEVTADFCSSNGLNVPFRSQFGPQISDDEQKELEALPAMCRSYKYVQFMQPGVTQPDMDHHFSLALRGYCKSTSPIRRYGDLVVHHQIKAFLRGDVQPHSREKVERAAAAIGATEQFYRRMDMARSRYWTLEMLRLRCAQHGRQKFAAMVVGPPMTGEFPNSALKLPVMLPQLGFRMKALTSSPEVAAQVKPGSVVLLEVETTTPFMGMERAQILQVLAE